MNYKEILFSILKHIDTNFLYFDQLKYFLWYSPASSSYLQRDTSFDDTLKDDKKYNVYFALLIMESFHLDNVYIYDVCDDRMKQDILNLNRSNLKDNVMYISLDNKTFFINFFDRQRNSLAHGTFNQYKFREYYVGQYKPCIESNINYLLQIEKSLFSGLKNVLNVVNDFNRNNICYFQSTCLNYYLDLTQPDMQNTNRYYSKKYNKYIIFDNDFSFKTSSYVDEIKELLKKYESFSDTIVIISDNRGHFSESTLTSYNGKVRIINTNNIIKYFDIPGVHMLSNVGKSSKKR